MKVLKLNHKIKRRVNPIPPYNFDASIFKPSHYPAPNEIYKKGRYWFVLRLNDKHYGIKLDNKGSIKKPQVEINIFSKSKLNDQEINEIIDELNFRFEFNHNINEFNKKFSKDRVLHLLLKKWKGMHNSCADDLYSLIMIGIFLQNTTVRRTVQMTNAMLNKYGIKIKFDEKEVYCFWKPEDMLKVSEEELRLLKVGYRAKLFTKVSENFIKDKINEIELRKLPTEELRRRLLRLYGVGKETARILLEETFHRNEVFNHVAPWQQKIYSRLLFNKKLVPVERIIKYINNKYGKWANLAASYIWEDIFWRRKGGERIKWLEKEIRL